MPKSHSRKSDLPEKNPNYLIFYPTRKHQEDVEFFIAGLSGTDSHRVLDAIFDLKKNPRPPGCIKIEPPITHLSHLAHYRIRQGDYRILYDIVDKHKKVFVLAVRRRNEQTYL